MPRTPRTRPRKRTGSAPKIRRERHWTLQEAKSRLIEIVGLKQTEGHQHVTIDGQYGVVLIAEEEFRRLKGDSTGAALVEAMRSYPYADVDLDAVRSPMPVRPVKRL